MRACRGAPSCTETSYPPPSSDHETPRSPPSSGLGIPTAKGGRRTAGATSGDKEAPAGGRLGSPFRFLSLATDHLVMPVAVEFIAREGDHICHAGLSRATLCRKITKESLSKCNHQTSARDQESFFPDTGRSSCLDVHRDVWGARRNSQATVEQRPEESSLQAPVDCLKEPCSPWQEHREDLTAALNQAGSTSSSQLLNSLVWAMNLGGLPANQSLFSAYLRKLEKNSPPVGFAGPGKSVHRLVGPPPSKISKIPPHPAPWVGRRIGREARKGSLPLPCVGGRAARVLSGKAQAAREFRGWEAQVSPPQSFRPPLQMSRCPRRRTDGPRRSIEAQHSTQQSAGLRLRPCFVDVSFPSADATYPGTDY